MDDILEDLPIDQWRGPFSASVQDRAQAALEAGKVVVCPRLSFAVAPAERRFLSAEVSGESRKNVSFDPRMRKLSNATLNPADSAELAAMMERFGASALQLLGDLVPAYAGKLVLARTSYRPHEIEGRVYSPRKDDRRLHVDAFPSRPLHGQRILRLFTNIAADGAPRCWSLGEPFDRFAQGFAPHLKPPLPGSAWMLEHLGVTKGRRSLYDHYMLSLHDLAKLDRRYRAHAPKTEVRFAPGTSWFCFTDQVLHSAQAGHVALEQTFYLPLEAMSAPLKAPLRVLEDMMGKALA